MQQQMKTILLSFDLGFLLISGGKEVNQFASIRLTLEANFCDNPLFPLVLESGANKWKKY